MLCQLEGSTGSHVLVEIFKLRQPAFANAYAPFPIVRKLSVSFVEASRFHGSPDVKFWRLRESVSESRLQSATYVTMFGYRFSGLFNMQTPTRLGVSVSKIRNHTGLLVSTVALAQKLSFLRRRSFRENRKHEHSTKSRSDQLGIRNFISHIIVTDSTRSHSLTNQI